MNDEEIQPLVVAIIAGLLWLSLTTLFVYGEYQTLSKTKGTRSGRAEENAPLVGPEEEEEADVPALALSFGTIHRAV